MEAQPTARQMAKGLLEGLAPPRPLFLPIVFSIGAKVENTPLGTFLNNPTKISNSLRQMRGHLRSDGVACYFDPYLEVEALGATVERRSDAQPATIHWPAPAQMHGLPKGLRSAEEVAKSERVSLASEVIRRMNALPQRDFLLMASVTGPLTLARRIPQGQPGEAANEETADAVQELAAAVATQTASAFVEAGADLIIIQEDVSRVFSPERCDLWANLLAPAFNVVRFYEALPVLQLNASSPVTGDWDVILGRQWDCVLCLPAGVMASRRQFWDRGTTAAAIGISLPLEIFRADGSGDEALRENLHSLISELRPAMVTTAGDPPATTDMKRLLKVLAEVPRAF